MYSDISDMRLLKYISAQDINKLDNIFNKIKDDYKKEWLICIEMLELCKTSNLADITSEIDLIDYTNNLEQKIEKYLLKLKVEYPDYKKFIEDGIKLLK